MRIKPNYSLVFRSLFSFKQSLYNKLRKAVNQYTKASKKMQRMQKVEIGLLFFLITLLFAACGEETNKVGKGSASVTVTNQPKPEPIFPSAGQAKPSESFGLLEGFQVSTNRMKYSDVLVESNVRPKPIERFSRGLFYGPNDDYVENTVTYTLLGDKDSGVSVLFELERISPLGDQLVREGTKWLVLLNLKF